MLFMNKEHEVYTLNKHKIPLDRDNKKTLVQTNGIKT